MCVCLTCRRLYPSDIYAKLFLYSCCCSSISTFLSFLPSSSLSSLVFFWMKLKITGKRALLRCCTFTLHFSTALQSFARIIIYRGSPTRRSDGADDAASVALYHSMYRVISRWWVALEHIFSARYPHVQDEDGVKMTVNHKAHTRQLGGISWCGANVLVRGSQTLRFWMSTRSFLPSGNRKKGSSNLKQFKILQNLCNVNKQTTFYLNCPI